MGSASGVGLRAVFASLAVVGGCSAHDGGGEAVDGGTAPSALAVSDEAGARIDALRTRFAVIGKSAVERFAPVGERVAVTVPDSAKRAVFRSASVELPSNAHGDVAVEDDTSHVAVRFALIGARDARMEIADGIALYRDALAYAPAQSGLLAGADVVHRVHAEGTEDFVTFETKPEVETLAYRVDVSRVAGLRLVSNVIEFLDEGGAPRLRVAPPWVVDAKGARHEAKLAIEGCAYDADPNAPWGRKITAPGASTCTVRVSWASANAWEYPALVDPSWVTTGSMTSVRQGHTATLLPSGKVLVAAGSTSTFGSLSTAELFDGTTGFAATGTMTTARGDFATATLLPSGKVLIAGGFNSSGRLSTAELFDGTGTFAPTGSMAAQRQEHTATLLPSGKVLIAGGSDGSAPLSSAELYDGASFFSATGSMKVARYAHTATLLPSGKVLMAGGVMSGAGYIGNNSDLFDGTSTFAATGLMGASRAYHTATLLASGKVLIAGGLDSAPTHHTTAELFDGTSTFAPTGSMTGGRRSHTAVRLGSGKVLIAGGENGAILSTAEMFDGTSTFASAGSMNSARWYQSATLLASGAVLVAGGTPTGGGAVSSAELFALPAGDTCGSPTACASGICNEHCCASACSGSCKTCAAGTGACTTVTSAEDPDSCSGTSSCNAAGTCLLKAGQPALNGANCLSGIADGGYCCAAACGSCQKCAMGTGACIAVTSADDPDTCSGTSGCSAAGTCLSKNGQPATSGATCLSGNASDGVCCNLACTGQCEACNVGGSVGTCIAVSGAPRGTRTACAGSGGCEAQCDGATRTSCGPFPTSSTTCASASCTSGTYTPARTCNGAGVCSPVSSTSCGAYTCNATVCRSSCTTATSATDCASGYFCSGGVCITTGAAGSVCTSPSQCASGKCVDGVCCTVASCTAPLKCSANGMGTCSKPLAAACTTNAECGSGNCVDGVCCDKACSGQCEACDVGGSVGTCVAVAGAVHGSARTACSGTGVCQATCDGADRTKCASIKGTSTSCAAASCASGIFTSIAFCDGAGGCATPASKSCAPYICEGSTACKTVCATSSDCAAGYGCKSGTCVTTGGLGTECTNDSQCASGHCAPGVGKSVCCSTATCPTGSVCADTTAAASAGSCLKSNGETCAAGGDCLSGSCADGVCCDKACSGQCEACDVPGSIGKCEAVTGPPHGTRTKCADGGGDACKALGCDGSKDRTKCSVYANGLEKECAPAACSAGLETPAAVCDGMGACGTAKPRPCSPYVCDTTKCKVACASNDDCAMGFSCNKTTAQCDPIEASCSDDELSSVPLDKTKPAKDCSPYRCNSATGDCNKTCVKSEECAPGRICDGTRCVDPTAPSDAAPEADAGGCGCSSPGKTESPRLALLLAIALVAARRRFGSARHG